MKKFLIAGVAAATFCGASAFAADMPVKGSIAAPMFSWKGCYLGIEGGGEWGRSEHHFTDGVLGARINMDGAIIGGTSGCNWQNGNWVLGYESDLSWSGLKNTAPNLFVPAFTFGTKSAWLSTTRARLGIAADRSLWYITGGLASSDIKASDSTAGAFEQHSKYRSGWTLGAGAEFALADPRWSWKIEYLYVDFGKHTYDFSNPLFANRNVDLKENIVRIGLNYRWGDGWWGKAPVSAKY